MELVKPIIRLGNSAGVILPREWLHGEARIMLLKRPENPKREIIEMLEPYLSSVIGLYLVGSYARNEQSQGSDIDVLAITTTLNKTIKRKKYDIILISQEVLENNLKKNCIPLLPMIREASPLINAQLLEKYRNTPLTKDNLRWHLETTNSALRLAHSLLAEAKEKSENVSDNIAYSLVLRLREAYMIAALMKNKSPTLSGLRALIKTITGSRGIYEAYQRSKAGVKIKKTVSVEEAESVYDYLINEIGEQKAWIKRNG